MVRMSSLLLFQMVSSPALLVPETEGELQNENEIIANSLAEPINSARLRDLARGKHLLPF